MYKKKINGYVSDETNKKHTKWQTCGITIYLRCIIVENHRSTRIHTFFFNPDRNKHNKRQKLFIFLTKLNIKFFSVLIDYFINTIIIASILRKFSSSYYSNLFTTRIKYRSDYQLLKIDLIFRKHWQV